MCNMHLLLLTNEDVLGVSDLAEKIEMIFRECN